MTSTSLVLDISHMGALVEETGGKALGVCEIASSIVADVDDESLTEHKVDEHLVEIALAHTILNTLVAHIGDIVVEDTIGCPGGYLVVGAEIAPIERVVAVGGITFLPSPIAGKVACRGEINMPITQFGKHIGEHLEELVGIHGGVYTLGIAGPHLIPVKPVGLALVVEKAIMLVEYLPQSLEIALWRIVVFILVNTRRKTKKWNTHYYI